MEESPCRNSTVSSDSHLEIGHLTIVILVVLSRVNLQFQDRFVPISLRPLLTLWQPVSWLQSGHHAVNFSTWWGFLFLQKSSQDMAHSFIYGPGGGTVKGP